MKKALALLLTLAMLATLGTVPAWAAEDVVFDIPVIEEVTEEELEEELELFGEVELMAANATNIANVTYDSYVAAEDDAVTYLTELDGANVSATGTKQGNIESVYNGIYTEGVKMTAEEYEEYKANLPEGETAKSFNAMNDAYPTIDGKTEGFMGKIAGAGDTAVTIDLGESEAVSAYSGIRLVDNVKARGMNARRATGLRIEVSDDATEWFSMGVISSTRAEGDNHADFFFAKKRVLTNAEARYIRFTVNGVNAHAEFEIEEIILLDENADNETLAPAGFELDYYTDAANWTWDAQEWTTTTPVTNLYDGTYYGGQGNCWHSPTGQATLHDVPITIMFDEPKAVGGVRLYPRTDGGGASPNVVTVQGTYDGENWVTMINKANLGITWTNEAPGSAYVYLGRDTTPLKGIKVLIDKRCDGATTGHTCFTELEVLKPVTPRSPLGTDEVTMGYPIGDAHVYRIKGDTVTETRSGAGYIVYDGIYLTPAWFQELGGSGGGYTDYQIHNDWCINASSQSTYTADSVYIVYDMGKVYEFSGIRLYQRVNGNQNFKEGYISISEDGENWVTSDKITVTPSVISTISDVKFGATAYNLKTRYIKIHCTASQATYHWAFEEVRLLKADDDKETKTAAQIKTIYDNAISAVTDVIDKYEAYEITLENAQEVMEAKSLYDNILNDAQKETVDGDKLATLNDAATELTHTVKVNTASASDPSGTVHAGNLGFATVDYKLYLKDGVTITGVTYDGEAISNTNKEWSVGEKAADGSVTLTLGGRYYGSDMQGRLADTVITSIQNGLNEAHGHYSKTTGAISGLTTGVTELTEDTFSGKFVREITMNKIGDNIITVNLSDGTTKEINLVADYVWASVPAGSATGSKDTDAITPKTSWKYATNFYSGNNVTSRGAKFFDGDYLYDNYSGTYTSPINEYAADGTVSKNHGNNHIAIAWVNGVWLDFGEPTSLSGVRLHMKETGSCFFYEGQVYGSNDLDSTNWTLLGTATSGGTRDMTIEFGENVTYQYIRIVMPNYGTEKWNRLVEIAVLAPKTHLLSASEIAADMGAGDVAEFDFDVLAGEAVTSLKDESDADVPYTMEDGTLTIADSYLKGVADGAHTFTVTFTNGQTFILKVTKGDTSKVDYLLYGYNNSTDLVLTNKTGKTVSSVTVVNGDVRADVAFIQSDDKGTITVKRQLFRRATDLYSTIDVDAPGKVNVEVKFDDNETFIYEVTVDSSWIDVTGEKTATYAYDEIVPGAWKVRVSSGNNINAGPHPLIKAPVGKRNEQHWHSYFGGIDGTVYGDSTKAIGHYYEIDFGENPEPYNGIRHLERAGGTTWNTNVTIVAKNAAEDEWTELYNGKPIYTSIGTYTDSDGTVQRYQTEMRFDDSYTYRYVRIHIKSSSEHITADNIKILKDTARLTSEATVTGDIVEAEEASFSFYLPENAAGVVSVANGETTVDAENYTFIDGVLTIKADYVATLGASTTLTVTIDGTAIDVTIVRKDIYSVSYKITDEATGRGTDDLVLVIPAGKTPTGITYGERTIAVDPEKIPVELVAGEKSLTIKRYVIRDLDDLFDKTEIKFNVNFSDGSSKEYKVTLSKEGKALTGVKTEAFAADEITPTEGDWTITASASNNPGEHVNLAFAKSAAGNNAWHSAYTDVKNEAGSTVAKRDSSLTRFYVDVDFGTETEIAGVRYYERVSHDSGVWNGLSVYGKDASGNWVLIKSQAFDVDALKNAAAAVVDVNFTEKVKYEEVRLVIDGTDYVTAKAITFLNTIPAPEVSEEEVNIKVTPTTGGNVYIVKGETETPSLGDNVVSANTEVTFKVGASDQSFFQYWIEANTGKILGNNPSLSVQTTVGKDIKAVFADPDSSEIFVSFFGRNAAAVVAHGYIKKGTAPTVPSDDKLYTTGYEFSKWVDEKGEDVDVTAVLNAGKSFYAEYIAKESKQSTITVTNGTGGGTYAYDKKVTVTANAAPSGEKFSHWVSGEKIVSYENPYKFYAPDHDMTLTAVYVAEDATVTEKIDIVMTVTTDTMVNNGTTVNIASFLTTRIVPENAKVIETGIIYTKDADETGLTIDKVGATSVNGKAIKVATCDKTASGQYKLTASYYELGIAARGFITYLDENDAVQTVYTEIITVG